jgi:hypothetical protein
MIRLTKMRHAVRRRVMELAVKLGGWTDATVTRARSDVGQTVAEYALVLLVVAAIAVAFLLWAKSSGKLDAFFDLIFDKLLNTVEESEALAQRSR